MLYTFEDIKTINNVRLFGNKAKSLIDLINWDIPVPDGCCITTEGLDNFIKINNFYQDIEDLLNLIKNDTIDHLKIKENIKKLQSMILEGKFPPKLKEQILSFLEKNPDEHFAVRSSGSMEDLEGLAFAGLYTSVLNVIGEDEVLRAIKKCWSSVFSYRVLKYCFEQNININEMLLAVIIQKMIPAKKSGILFTVNPTTGIDKDVFIEACFGLGEAVVSGLVKPDLYTYNWFNNIETHRTIQNKEIAIITVDEYPFTKKINLSSSEKKKEVLSQEEVMELTNIAINIQLKYGFPVDIEWVKSDDRFYIVQSSPITKINFSSINGEWTTANFRNDGISSSVCSPFMWSLYDSIWEIVMPKYLKKTKLIKNDKNILWGNMFFGRPYWNLKEVKNGLKKLPNFIEKNFDESFDIEKTYKDNGFVSKTNLKTIWLHLQVLQKLKNSFKKQIKFCPKFKKEQNKRLQELDKIDIKNMNSSDFFEFYKNFIKKDYFLSKSSYLYLVFDAYSAETFFKKTFLKITNSSLSNKQINFSNLISGLIDLSHPKQNYKFWELIKKIKNDSNTYEYWKTKSVKEIFEDFKSNKDNNLMNEFESFIEEFKYHSTKEFDITIPRYIEDPTYIIENIKTNIDFDESLDPKEINKKQYEIYEEEKKYLLESLVFYKKEKIKKELEQFRNLLWWREEFRNLSVQIYYYVRIFTLKLGEYFYEMEILESRDDIFFLSINDIFDIMDNKISKQEAKYLIQKNKIYYQSFRNFQNPNEIGSKFKTY